VTRYPVIVAREAGYIPFDAETAACSSGWCRPGASAPARSWPEPGIRPV